MVQIKSLLDRDRLSKNRRIERRRKKVRVEIGGGCQSLDLRLLANYPLAPGEVEKNADSVDQG